MRGKRKRRHNRTWFPVEGQEATEEILPTGEFWAFTTGTLKCLIANPRAADVLGLTFDFPPEVEEAAGTIPSLADWQGAAWQLASIVGKIHIGIRQDADQTYTSLLQHVLVMAWFAVLQVDDQGVPREADLLKYDPMLASNIRQPYV